MAGTVDHFRYWQTPYRVERGEDGVEHGYLLNRDTGRFDTADDLVFEVVGATTTSHITTVPVEQYVWECEELRQQLSGEGPVFALYDTIEAIYANARSEGRKRLDPAERALVTSLRQRTHGLWEDDERRRAAGQEPKNVVTGKRGQR
ncbi:hypothetical protein [Actinokineospora spheciospongiae]|nr:hypothetical protein [Actinokineospora spheciospongiae]PWW63479.1 hypothetical protein DFQ13_104471 [Actinokineospora spheciospongiae]